MSIRDNLRRAVKVQESVATTIYYDFYGSRTGIHNRIPICPTCELPRVIGEKAGVGPARCQCPDFLEFQNAQSK